MSTPTPPPPPPPPPSQGDEQGQQAGEPTPTLADLLRRAAELRKKIDQHLRLGRDGAAATSNEPYPPWRRDDRGERDQP